MSNFEFSAICHDGLSDSATLRVPKRRIAEIFFLLLYVVICVILSAFHEPWFDEAQAWMIARSASLKEILFTIPHYEGHPPLWHLILMPFARLGCPYELTLGAISITFSTISAGLILFKSNLPRFLRRVLPFTYFFLYQYGVISRPYSLLVLAFILAAIAWRRRNEHPGRFAASLGLICLSSSYGIVLSAGIALVWLYEIWNRQHIGRFFCTFIHDRRFFCLLALLILGVVLILTVRPAPDANGVNMEDISQGFFARLFFMLLIAPTDALFLSNMSYGALVWQTFSVSTILVAGCAGIFLMSILFWIGEKAKTTALLFIPYILYAVFAAKVYFWLHHIGIFTIFLVFWLWITFEQPDTDVSLSPRTAFAQFLVYALTMFSCAMSVFWTICAGAADIQGNYGHGRTIAEFIDQYHLTDYPMLVSWEHEVDENTGEEWYNLSNCPLAYSILPYYNENPFINVSDGSHNYFYSSNRAPDDGTNKRIADYVLTQPIPRVLIGDCFLDDIYQNQECADMNYIPVYVVEDNYIWKNVQYENHYYIFMDDTLAKELGLSAIQVPEWTEAN